MQKPLALLVTGLFFGTGLGFLMITPNGITLDGQNHSPLSTGDKPLIDNVVIQVQ